jgi:hypothetical protein
MSLRIALASLAVAASAASANAASITLDGLSTPIEYNAEIRKAPGPVASGMGNTVASGQKWSGGLGFGSGIEDDFLAWCFDLIHPVGLGKTYEYELVERPYSNSYLLSGAKHRVSQLFNANYAQLDATDSVQAAAFQLAVWEVANDDDFNIATGPFQAGGLGRNSGAITSTAQSFLSGSESFSGPFTWKTAFLETREASATQNLVTAIHQTTIPPVPLPAGGLLLMSGLCAIAVCRRFSI